ncbi:Flagellar hook-length control protein FliK [Pararobbsia alpina]|uniref:flagellar hook-length control protein FliK n=1 Tax=Pararobbsia alpina TaxID=621374 RepID=UPI0039A5EF10
MSGIDPALASALASRIDALLSAVSAPTDAKSAQAADATAATQWANTQQVVVPDANTPPPASAQAVLSQTARTLDVISRGADGEPAPPVIGRQALWSTAPGATATGAVQGQAFAGLASSLAMALEQALDTSGLFYESHLVQWLAGQRSSALLSQEPQSQLPTADDEAGWPYDAEAALRALAQGPVPFTGQRSSTASIGTGSETIDVEVAEADDGPGGSQSGAHATQTGPQGATTPAPGNSGQAGLARLALAAASGGSGGLDALLLDAASEEIPGEASPDAGTALVVAGRDGDPNGSAASANGLPSGALPGAAHAASYAPSPSSTLFANEGNAAYAAQAAVQVHESPEAFASATDRALASAAQNNPTLQASGAPTSLPIHPDALSIVRQQLELLQAPEPRFRWSGEAWPDSRMYWELDWDPDDRASPDQRVWRTRIAIELPTLGLVDAELTLTGHRLGARITADGQTIATLKEGTSDFMRALAGAGLNLDQLAIRNADGSLPARARTVDSASGTSTPGVSS